MYILFVTSIKKLHPMITLSIFYYRLLNTLMFKDESPYASEIVPKQVTTLYLGSRNN